MFLKRSTNKKELIFVMLLAATLTAAGAVASPDRQTAAVSQESR